MTAVRVTLAAKVFSEVPGPPGWGLGIELHHQVVKTQLSENPGRCEDRPEDGPKRERKRRKRRRR